MLRLQLSPEQQAELESLRDRGQPAYLRERAAAILKVAAGNSATTVARHLLLRPRDPFRVRQWVRRYQVEGTQGLYQRPRGGGRPPGAKDRVPRKRRASSPARTDPHHLHAALARPPTHQPRWTLAQIRDSVTSLGRYTLSGVYQCLRRAGIVRKGGREYIHSPDPDYALKEEVVLACRQEAQTHYGRVALVYGDEKSYYRQPTVARDYHPVGPSQPLARRSYRANTLRRIVGALDATSGRLIYRQGSSINLAVFQQFLQELKSGYLGWEKVYLVLDNWQTVHRHPRVREKAAQLGITLLYLPTYAPWLNPIEKLWRWLSQEVLHLHRLADDWLGLQGQVQQFLDQFAGGDTPQCRALLRYVGLAPP